MNDDTGDEIPEFGYRMGARHRISSVFLCPISGFPSPISYFVRYQVSRQRARLTAMVKGAHFLTDRALPRRRRGNPLADWHQPGPPRLSNGPGGRPTLTPVHPAKYL